MSIQSLEHSAHHTILETQSQLQTFPRSTRSLALTLHLSKSIDKRLQNHVGLGVRAVWDQGRASRKNRASSRAQLDAPVVEMSWLKNAWEQNGGRVGWEASLPPGAGLTAGPCGILT